MEVHYEDVVQKPRETLVRLGAFLEQNPPIGRRIVDKSLTAARARGGSTQGVNMMPTVTGKQLWKTIAPVMFPSASVSLPCRTQMTPLNFSGSSVANGEMMSASAVALMPRLAERSTICPTKICADKYQREREEGLERCAPCGGVSRCRLTAHARNE